LEQVLLSENKKGMKGRCKGKNPLQRLFCAAIDPAYFFAEYVTVQPYIFLPACSGQEALGVCLMKI
jgi:hypothetical protein